MTPDEFNSLRKWFSDEMQDVYFSLPNCSMERNVDDLMTLMCQDQDSADEEQIIRLCAIIGATAMKIANGYKALLRVKYEEEARKNKDKNEV